ncbi:cobalamin biosynthesis protein [Granulicella sp. dw_53]|uniref:cobalamin biosynthesis protein n=1 Tax=Granulicella sp. dw_53 TaxID=2719792 RepID=UPI001BD658BC|nr:cobalamin biosynthesis protein [Granulicella sp. dw_53]
MTQEISIGIGCSSRATGEDVIRLVESCVTEVAPDGILATLDRCAGIGEQVAKALGLRLMLFPASTLAQVSGVENPSAKALERVGTSSVAEASALAALGPEARLLIPRRIGSFCTCAVAVLP